MTQPKAQTMQQRFGFQDKELSTPKHDEIMLWLDRWVDTELDTLLKWGEASVYEWRKSYGDEHVPENLSLDSPMHEWRKDCLDETNPPHVYELNGRTVTQDAQPRFTFSKAEHTCNESLESLGLDSPVVSKVFLIKRKIWECPILDRNYTIGFADMQVIYEPRRLLFHRDEKVLTTGGGSGREAIYFEVKPSIPSLGELIRQIRMYQTYTSGEKWVVVSPDATFKNQLASQGIHFIEVTL